MSRALCKFGWCRFVAIGMLASGIALAQQPNQRLVDDDALRTPAAEEWLTYGRDWAETHFSPLKQIDTTNVKRLGLAWSYETGTSGLLESTPLVSNGVFYATTSWSTVFALDARTGKRLWAWDPAIPRSGGTSLCCGPGNRGVGLYKGKVYISLFSAENLRRRKSTTWSRSCASCKAARKIQSPANSMGICGIRGKAFCENGRCERRRQVSTNAESQHFYYRMP